jgi:hypothetical protein
MLTNPQRKPVGRLAWGLLLALSGAWLSIGCSPATVYMLLVPFTDNNTPAKFKIANPDKEVTVAVVSNFSNLETRAELIDAHNELAQKFVASLEKRAKENKEKLKFIPLAQVRSRQNKLGANPTSSVAEIGKHFKADYVISLEIVNIDLFLKGSSRQLYQGITDISVQLFDMSKEEGERRVHEENFRREYPRTPIDAGGSTPSQFRGIFLSRVGNDLSRIFTSYPPEERHDE